MPLDPLEAYAFCSRLGKRSVFFLDPHLTVINRRLFQQILPVLKGTERRFISFMSFVPPYGIPPQLFNNLGLVWR